MNKIFLYPAESNLSKQIINFSELVRYNILGCIGKVEGNFKVLEINKSNTANEYINLEDGLIKNADALFIIENDQNEMDIAKTFLELDKNIIKLKKPHLKESCFSKKFNVFINNTNLAFSVVKEFRKYGYRVNILSNSIVSELFLEQDHPDLTIIDKETVSSDSVASDQYLVINCKENLIDSIILHKKESVAVELLEQPIHNENNWDKCREVVKIIKEEFFKLADIYKIIEEDIKLFQKNEINQFNRFQILDSFFLFEANTRSSYVLNKRIYDFLEMYFENADKLPEKCFSIENVKFLINAFEAFSKIRHISRLYGRKLEQEILEQENWHSGESIISFIGKKNCNLRCKYCFMDDEKGKFDSEELSEELIRNGLDFILKRKENTHRVRADYSLGGEPILSFDTYQKLWSIIKEYDEREDGEVALGFITNATLLNDEVIQWFNKYHHWIGFSLDGGRAVHDSMRVFPDGKGSFDVAYSNISKVLDLKWEHNPGVNVVLTAANPNILDIFLDLWKLGFRIITIKPVRANSKEPFAITLQNIDIIKENYLKFASYLIDEAKKGSLEYLKAILVPFDFFGRFLMRVFMRDRVIIKRCPGGSRIFSVRNNGDIYPCDSFNGMDAFKIGNLKEKTFDQTLFVPQKVTEAEGCKDCWARYLCGGVCSYTAYINRSSGETASDAECELEKYLIMLSCYLWSELKENIDRERIDEIKEYINLMTGGSTW